MPTNSKKDYTCPKCGSQEYITKPNQYDTFILIDGKIHFQSTELTHEEIELYCRECSRKIEYKDEDLIF